MLTGQKFFLEKSPKPLESSNKRSIIDSKNQPLLTLERSKYMKATIYPEHEAVVESTHHAFIAGATGSGKSTFVRAVINSILIRDPHDYQMVLIDPKKVELSEFSGTQHCIGYAEDIEDIETLLDRINDLVDRRYKAMKEAGVRTYRGTKVYVIIDELAEVFYQSKKAYTSLERLARLARATNIQLICATQCLLAEVVPTRLKMNLDLRVALPVATAGNSRVILDTNGAETLTVGEAIIKQGIDVRRVKTHEVNEDQITQLIALRQRRGRA